MATIKSGKDGNVAGVDADNRLMTEAVVTDARQFLNGVGSVFSLHFEVTPAGADDYFFYLKNTGTGSIVVGSIDVSSTVATEITYEAVSGTAVFVGETDITPVNNNLGSANPLAAQAVFDTDITGLTSDGVFSFEEAAVADTRYPQTFQGGILIPQGKAVAFKRVAATGQITCTVGVAELN